MSAPKQPIPLRSPDGRVYTYACGQCRHVCGTGTRLSALILDPWMDAHEAAAYLRLSDCGAVRLVLHG